MINFDGSQDVCKYIMTLGSDHLIFIGGGWGQQGFCEKKIPGPNFPEKIFRTGKVLIYALSNLQIKRQEKNIQARKHLPLPHKNQMVAPL